jgi:hypothetical protein
MGARCGKGPGNGSANAAGTAGDENLFDRVHAAPHFLGF